MSYFCVGYTNAWPVPIHILIKEAKERFGLTWLRFGMSYHRFTNLRELLQGNLTTKLNKDVTSLDFQPLECNCRPGKGDKGCGYNNICRNRMIVYENTCLNTGKQYIGQTQQHFKKRMEGHFQDTQKLLCKQIKSDSCAKHFAHQLQNFKHLCYKGSKFHNIHRTPHPAKHSGKAN